MKIGKFKCPLSNQLIRVMLIVFFISSTILAQKTELLHKKWKYDGCKFLGIKISPEEKELNDYIMFLPDSTYHSIDEGEYTEGTWRWTGNFESIIMFDDTEDDSLIFKNINIKDNKLTMEITDNNDKLKVFFVGEK